MILHHLLLSTKKNFLTTKYKKLKGDRSGPGCFIPMPPLNLFKLASQFVYNKGKGGLDKGTEQEARILRPKVKVAFEGKYILRMISAIVINAWRSEEACTLLRPFLVANPHPSVKQLRSQLYQLIVQDFAYTLAHNLLKILAIQRNMFGNHLAILPVPTTPNPIVAEREDAEIVAAVVVLHSSAYFPPYRHRPRCYNRPPLKTNKVLSKYDGRPQHGCHDAIDPSQP
jgi:hypothetical protein